MIKVLLADDHPVVRKGIRQCILENPDMEVAHEACTAGELFAFLDRSPCDVVVLNFTPTEPGVPETLCALRQSRPGLPVLIVTLFAEQTHAENCRLAGAAGVLNLSSEPAEFAEAIRKAARDARRDPREPDGKPATDRRAGRMEPPHRALSVREFQVFCQIAQGRAQKAIAAGLGLSAKTICTHRFRILKKLCIQSNADIVRYALTHQLVS